MATKIPDNFGDAGFGLAGSGAHGEPTIRGLLRELQTGVTDVFTTADRPLDREVGAQIWNSDDGAPNWWNGSQWVNALGNPT